MQLSQPTLEPHSLCHTCWVQVVYSLLPLLYFFLLATLLLLSSCRHEGVRSALPGLRGLLGVRLPVDVPVAPCFSFGEFLPYLYFASAISDIFVIIVINNICTRFIISFYVIYAMIYCSFCFIYVWLDLGTYMIARFMSFYKLGVTLIHLCGCTMTWSLLSCSSLLLLGCPCDIVPLNLGMASFEVIVAVVASMFLLIFVLIVLS